MYLEQRGDGARMKEGHVEGMSLSSFFKPINYKSIIIINSLNDIHSPIKQATTKIF